MIPATQNARQTILDVVMWIETYAKAMIDHKIATGPQSVADMESNWHSF